MSRNAPGWRWQDEAAGGGLMDEEHPMRRSGVGSHDIRFDGLSDLILRAHGCSVIDVGCNRGHVAYDFAINGARIVHGCDIYGPGIAALRHWFAEMPHVQSKFEVVDLEKGPAAFAAAFGDEGYDIVLFIGIYHKLKRLMQPKDLNDLVADLGCRALTYFGWNGYMVDLPAMDVHLKEGGLTRVHTSRLTALDRASVIWRRL